MIMENLKSCGSAKTCIAKAIAMSIFLCYQLSDLYVKGDEQDSSVQPENLDGSIASNLGTHVIQHLLSFEEN
jgi:hypothetical protein